MPKKAFHIIALKCLLAAIIVKTPSPFDNGQMQKPFSFFWGNSKALYVRKEVVGIMRQSYQAGIGKDIQSVKD